MDTRKAYLKMEGDIFNTTMPSGSVKMGYGALSPMELLLASLAGCTAIDVQSILRKMRFNFSLDVEIEGKRREEHPRIYTEINITYKVEGDVPERAVKRAVSLSLNRYCSATAMVSKVSEINYAIILNGKEVDRGKKGHLEG